MSIRTKKEKIKEMREINERKEKRSEFDHIIK